MIKIPIAKKGPTNLVVLILTKWSHRIRGVGRYNDNNSCTLKGPTLSQWRRLGQVFIHKTLAGSKASMHVYCLYAIHL